MSQILIDKDKQFISKLRQDPLNEKFISEHLKEITTSPHAISNLILLFTKQLHLSPLQPSLSSPKGELSNPMGQESKKVIEALFTDINAFTEKTIAILFTHYWQYDSQLLETQLQKFINRSVLQMGLHEKIINFYRCPQKDAQFSKKCKALSHWSLQDFAVDPKYFLEAELHPYEKAINIFKEIQQPLSIDSKLEVIANSITEISSCVNRYNLEHKSRRYDKMKNHDSDPAVEEAFIGAEDLIPIFMFVIVRSRVDDLMAIFAFLNDCMTDDMIKGSAGFCMASLETAMMGITKIDLLVTKGSNPQQQPQQNYDKKLSSLNPTSASQFMMATTAAGDEEEDLNSWFANK